jgi:MoaA/NifB/PqqE/SkfB family radical SAM enzyme
MYRAHVRKDRLLEPVAVTWHATNLCNLRCTFCDDGKGNSYPDLKSYTMTTAEVKQVLGLARRKVTMLYITGGEPLLRKDLSEIIRWAKEEAGFLWVGLITNGLLLRRQEDLLPYVDDLALSLHALEEPQSDALLGAGEGKTRAIQEAILRYAALAHEKGYYFNVSCVARPERLHDAREVMSFCFDHGVAYTVMPQSVGPYPHPDLVGNTEYRRLIDDLMTSKRRGEPVWGSRAYYRTIRDFVHFRCYPTVNLRIFPNGDLVYPCSPLNRVAGSLLGAESFDAVLAEGIAAHGPVPTCDTRCFASCYIEPSHAIQFPATLIFEHLMLLHRLRRALPHIESTNSAVGSGVFPR